MLHAQPVAFVRGRGALSSGFVLTAPTLAKLKRYRSNMGKVEEVVWHAVACLVLCLVVFARGCVRAMQMG